MWTSHGAVRVPSILLLILGTALLRSAFGAALGLGVDESYMVATGRVLSLGYYNHPPASWWLAWGAAHLTGSELPIVVRLPFIGPVGFATWLMYRLGSRSPIGARGSGRRCCSTCRRYSA